MKLKIIRDVNMIIFNERLNDSYIREFDKYIKEVKSFSDVNLRGVRYWDLLRKEEKYDDSFIMLSRRNKCQGFIHFTREEGFIFVNYLYIKKSQRKRGYGKKLLNLTKADRIQLFCQPENKNAQEFYRHLSFKKLPESGNPDLDRLELVIHKNKLSYTS